LPNQRLQRTPSAAPPGAEAELLKDLLDREGIAYLMRNEQPSTTIGGVPFTECYPELWILNDVDFAKAKDLLDTWLSPETTNP